MVKINKNREIAQYNSLSTFFALGLLLLLFFSGCGNSAQLSDLDLARMSNSRIGKAWINSKDDSQVTIDDTQKVRLLIGSLKPIEQVSKGTLENPSWEICVHAGRDINRFFVSVSERKGGLRFGFGDYVYEGGDADKFLEIVEALFQQNMEREERNGERE